MQFLLVINNSCHGDATVDHSSSAHVYLPHDPDTTKFGFGRTVSSPTPCNKGGALDVRDPIVLPFIVVTAYVSLMYAVHRSGADLNVTASSFALLLNAVVFLLLLLSH